MVGGVEALDEHDERILRPLVGPERHLLEGDPEDPEARDGGNARQAAPTGLVREDAKRESRDQTDPSGDGGESVGLESVEAKGADQGRSVRAHGGGRGDERDGEEDVRPDARVRYGADNRLHANITSRLGLVGVVENDTSPENVLLALGEVGHPGEEERRRRFGRGGKEEKEEDGDANGQAALNDKKLQSVGETVSFCTGRPSQNEYRTHCQPAYPCRPSMRRIPYAKRPVTAEARPEPRKKAALRFASSSRL